MALIVEDGSVVTGADSYVTLVEFQDYWAARNVDLTQHGHDSSHEADLRQAYDVINHKWEYKGTQVEELVQTGAFPRYIPRARFEYVVPPDSIPSEVKSAQMEMAYLIHEGAAPFATVDGMIKTERNKADVLEEEIEYFGGKGRQAYPKVEALLRKYFAAGAGQLAMARG